VPAVRRTAHQIRGHADTRASLPPVAPRRHLTGVGGEGSRLGETWRPGTGISRPTMRDRSKILVEDPGLAEALGGERLSAAVRDCVAVTTHVPRGAWDPGDDLDGFNA